MHVAKIKEAPKGTRRRSSVHQGETASLRAPSCPTTTLQPRLADASRWLEGSLVDRRAACVSVASTRILDLRLVAGAADKLDRLSRRQAWLVIRVREGHRARERYRVRLPVRGHRRHRDESRTVGLAVSRHARPSGEACSRRVLNGGAPCGIGGGGHARTLPTELFLFEGHELADEADVRGYALLR